VSFHRDFPIAGSVRNIGTSDFAVARPIPLRILIAGVLAALVVIGVAAVFLAAFL